MADVLDRQLPDADACERIFHAALSAGDVRGVYAALRILAVVDPRRAEELLECTRAALALADEIDPNPMETR